MRRCVRCKQPIPEEATVCPSCGMAQPRSTGTILATAKPIQKGTCPKCGADTNGEKFCPKCGYQVVSDMQVRSKGSLKFMILGAIFPVIGLIAWVYFLVAGGNKSKANMARNGFILGLAIWLIVLLVIVIGGAVAMSGIPLPGTVS